MSGVLLRLSDLPRAPEFHLDELLDVLRQTPDGFSTKREVEIQTREGRNGPYNLAVARWELDAQGYCITVRPNYECGYLEEGDGKVLTAITGRLAETNGAMLLSTQRERNVPVEGGSSYVSVVWGATVYLGEQLGNWEPNPHQGCLEFGRCETPGVAALIAYLRAWGVLA